MRGRIISINQRRGMFVVETEANDCSLVEMLGNYDIEVGNIVDGNLHSLGGEKLKNISIGEIMDVYMQNWGMNRKHATTNLKQF